ncbi:MAG: DUF4375 domain-containing protein [Betaproteobacteria bacterium]|nr:DUF4375 domain-containing protein [Betaproteobacteria bacterium]
MRFDTKTPPWAVAALAAFFGALIWALAPAIAGKAEPWDDAAYYLFALPVAGVVSGLLAGRPLWSQYMGVILGQFAYALIFLAMGPLALLGVGFTAVYALLFLGGSLLGIRLRQSMAAQDSRERGTVSHLARGAQFLDRYDGQSTRELLSLQATHRIDSLVLAFEEAVQKKRAARDISREESFILAIEALEREVNNGGYSQFFANASNEFVPMIAPALEAIDCPKAAMITRDATSALGTGAALAPEIMANAANDPAVRRRLAECDALYYSNDEAIAEQLFRWIEERPEKIEIGSSR